MRVPPGVSRRGVLLAAGAVLGGCGLRPLYGEGSVDAGVQARLAEINVQLIPERSGQLLRQALQARLERGAAGVARRYDLSVQVALSTEHTSGCCAHDSFRAFRMTRRHLLLAEVATAAGLARWPWFLGENISTTVLRTDSSAAELARALAMMGMPCVWFQP